MSLSERDLEPYGEQFLTGLEAIGRSLNLYPAQHPTVRAQCERLIAGFRELAERTGEAVLNFVNAELYLNGVPLKRLSLTHEEQIRDWERKGIGLISVLPDELTPESMLGLHAVIGKSRDELRAAGGIGQALEAAGVVGIRAGRVSVGIGADATSMVDGDAAIADEPEEEVDLDTARSRYQDGFQRLLVAVQGAASVDPRVRMVRNLSQLLESRLLERQVVRDLAARLRAHDKESYRHALGGAVIAVLMASALGCRPRSLRLVGEAALLRDIGKLDVDPEVLHGRDRDDATRAEYQRHPTTGAKRLLAERGIDPVVASVAYEHHARFDCKGFPALAGRPAPHPFSRLVAIASDYDRMTGGYPGLPFTTVWEAVASLIQGAGSAYDPSAIRAFLRVVGCVPEGTPVRLIDGREGIVSGTGQSTWLCPEVAVLRDSGGNPVEPMIIRTDELAPAGESVIHSYLPFSMEDSQRLEALRDFA